MSGQRPPNFLILMADQMTPFALPPYGHPVVRAPAMAAEGVVFDAAYRNSPLCAPSRAALVSGLLLCLCCANIAPVAACQLVEVSTDPDGGWHTEACHPVQRVASDLCFNLLTGQSPGEESPSNDGFVPVHCSLNKASPVVAETTLPADATMLFDDCNMLIPLWRPTRTWNRCRPRWNDDVSLRMPISDSVVDSLTILCAVCYH